MYNTFFLNKRKIGFAITLLVIFNISSIWFINNPENFIRNFLIKKEHIQIIGFLMLVYSLIMLYSFIILLFQKKDAFKIYDNYLIDNSKFESLGKIKYSEIKQFKRIKKASLEIVLNEPIFKSRKISFIKKILLIANNWNYKNTVIVSSALLNCNIKTLENSISFAIEKYRKENGINNQ